MGHEMLDGPVDEAASLAGLHDAINLAECAFRKNNIDASVHAASNPYTSYTQPMCKSTGGAFRLTSAANFENSPRRIRSRVGKQPQHPLRNLIRRSASLHRYRGTYPRQPPGFATRRMEPGVHQTRSDGVHA